MPRFAGSARPSYAELWRSNRLLWVVCAFLVVGSTTLFLIDLNARENAALDYTKRFALSFADVLAEHAARTFEAVERTLKAAEVVRAQQEAGSISAPAVKLALQNLRNGAPAILAVGWTDAAGNVVAHSYDGPPARPSIADLPHFYVLRDAPQDRLYIGSLYRSVVKDIWISSAALRMTDSDGRFTGVISAPLNIAYFSSIFRAVQLGEHDVVGILRQDGTMLFREPFVEPSQRTAFGPLSAFAAGLRVSPFGTFEATSPVDGRQRVYAYRTIPDTGLVMVVAQDRGEALAVVYRDFFMFGSALLVFILVVILGTWLLARKNSLHMRQTKLLEATLENMHEGLMVVDSNDRIAVCNHKAVALLDVPFGLVQDYPPVQSVIDFLSAKGEFDRLSDDIRSRLKPETVVEEEQVYVRQRPNGTLLEVRTVPFSGGGVLRTYSDVTEQRRIAGELTRSEREFRLLAESATDIIARFDLAGRLHYISPSCLPILGYAPEELICNDIADYVHPDDVEAMREAFAGIVAGSDRTGKVEYRLRHKAGHYLWLEANPTVVCNDADVPYELVDVMRDVTDRKRIEAEAAAAKQQAEQAARAKGEFLASMSHELRTPLHSIIGFARILLGNNDLDREMRRQVGLISTASDSLLAIVNDVLDYSQVEEGKLQIVPVRFALSELIDGSLEIVKEAAKAKNLNLMTEYSGDIELLGDSLRLRQILLNFLNNAIKFTSEGVVSLGVTMQASTGDKRMLRFSVVDTGIGIAPDKHDRLFQRFSQVDSSIGRRFGGSGLGLAICKKLTELMHGRIGFSSKPGAGSTFWFEVELPLAPPELASQPDEIVAPPLPNKPVRVLLVEDILINSEIAVSLLSSRGYLVDPVFDGTEAVRAVQEQPYDVVLMDVQMPGMDGITATRMIRQLPSAVADIPIIAMTANVLPKQVRQLEEAGMVGHIGKPFQIDDLVSIIETHRARDRGMAQAQTSQASVQALLGQDKFDALSDMLVDRLRQFAQAAEGYDASLLATQAHKLTSAAGFLGFAELSKIFAELERRATNGEVPSGLLKEAIARSTATVAAITATRARLAV